MVCIRVEDSGFTNSAVPIDLPKGRGYREWASTRESRTWSMMWIICFGDMRPGF